MMAVMVVVIFVSRRPRPRALLGTCGIHTIYEEMDMTVTPSSFLAFRGDGGGIAGAGSLRAVSPQRMHHGLQKCVM